MGSLDLSVRPSVRAISREPLNFFQKSLWIIIEGPKTEAKFVNGQNLTTPSGSFKMVKGGPNLISMLNFCKNILICFNAIHIFLYSCLLYTSDAADDLT